MIKVNGRDIEWEKDLTVDLLLKRREYAFPLMIVKINGSFISREEYKDTLVMDNDNVQVVHTIAGG